MAHAIAGFSSHQSYLSTDFGMELAMKKTGLNEEQLAELVGRYKKGARKGKLKGLIHWYKVTHGGWYKTGRYDFDSMQGSGFVVRYIGMNFAFGISVQPFREAQECKWGFDSVNGDITQPLAKACAQKQKEIEDYKNSLKSVDSQEAV